MRPTEPDDRSAVLDVVRCAFAKPGDDASEEVQIVTDTWRLEAAVRGLDLVAVTDGRVIGHVLGARGNLGGREVVAVAPLAVVPAQQRRGVGTALMTQLVATADQSWPLTVLLGDLPYYARFGFELAWPFDIIYGPPGRTREHFLVRRLRTYDSSYGGSFRYCWEPEPPA